MKRCRTYRDSTGDRATRRLLTEELKRTTASRLSGGAFYLFEQLILNGRSPSDLGQEIGVDLQVLEEEPLEMFIWQLRRYGYRKLLHEHCHGEIEDRPDLCHWCAQSLPPHKRGRRRRYCDDHCKQNARRERQTLAGQAQRKVLAAQSAG